MNATTKHCKSCQTTKPLAKFYKTKSGAPRFCCQECSKANSRRNDVGRYRKNPTTAKARYKRWQKKHPAQFREIMRIAVAKQRRKKIQAGTPELPLNSPTPCAPDGPPASPSAPDECPPPPKTKCRKSNPEKL